jgi:hypothetical protein
LASAIGQIVRKRIFDVVIGLLLLGCGIFFAYWYYEPTPRFWFTD